MRGALTAGRDANEWFLAPEDTMRDCGLILSFVVLVGCTARPPTAPSPLTPPPRDQPTLFTIVGIHQGGPADPDFPEGGGYGPLLPPDADGGYTLRLNNDYTLEASFSPVPAGHCLAYSVSYSWRGPSLPESQCFPQIIESWNGFNTPITDSNVADRQDSIELHAEQRGPQPRTLTKSLRIRIRP